jgi:GH15 family glucan-1,4-alpha-glucosidase
VNYPLIADHGLIGDLQTAALVATDGTIDWFCCPRFDSPSVFASLLDHRKGGQFAISAVGDCVTKQMYFPDTAILVTRFLSEGGVAELVDFMPIEHPGTATKRHRLVRGIRGVRGKVQFDVRVEPRFDYGRQSHHTEVNGTSARFETNELTLDLTSSWPLEHHGGDARARITVEAGDLGGLVLESGADGHPTVFGGGEVAQLLDDTMNYWRRWVERGTYRGRWREAVYRSAITLKLMTYAPTGALVAAPTAGLPEQVGGERNWDYRYTWIRDGSFSVYALLGLGFTDEAAGFSTWIRDRVEERRTDGGTPLNIMYRVDGSSDLDEFTLDHWEGYRGSSPVRIGNGAASQLQLDIYGEAMDSIYFIDQGPFGVADEGWNDLVGMLDWLCENWDQPDEGIWETRGGRKPFVYGRLMSWVALDRAIRMAVKRSRPADLPRWTAERDRIYRTIMDKGWNDDLQAFSQYEGSDVLDASNLLIPLVGFLVPNDPKWQSTLSAMDKTLVSDSLVYRYDPKASPDGLRGSEGTFSLCTFWYVDALARSGRLQDARLTFEKMLTYANHVGLFSEEIGATGEQLGNFPQAFTHLSLINAAINLDYQLDHGAGQVSIETGPPRGR